MIQSVERALQILELLDGGEALGGMELSRLTGLKQPTVHNFLKTLAACGYIEQVESASKYRLAERARFLGWAGGRKQRLIDIASPFARRLRDAFNETVLLTVSEGNLRLTLLVLESSRTLAVRPTLRMDSKFYSSATGRGRLTRRSEAELQRLVHINGLPLTGEWRGVTTEDEMHRALEKIRSTGMEYYAFDGVAGIGATVYAQEAGVLAALGMHLPESRCCAEMQNRLALALCATAQEIATALEEPERASGI